MPTTSAVAAPRIIGSDARTSYSQLDTISAGDVRDDEADRGADNGKRAPLLEDEPEHVARGGAEGEPDCHLAPSLSRAVGDDAVDADRRQRHGRGAEPQHQRHPQLLPAECRAHDVGRPLDVHRHLRIELAHLVADRRP